jgi:HPt (histidine-containing phosphotransfer) domain-containing protein
MQDVGKLDDLAHKIKMTLYYVQAKKLGQFIQEARELVNKEEKDPKQCQKKLQALQSAFQEVIDGLKSVKSRDLIGMNR